MDCFSDQTAVHRIQADRTHRNSTEQDGLATRRMNRTAPQFRLSTLFVALAVVSALFATARWMDRRRLELQRSQRELERLGVDTDWDVTSVKLTLRRGGELSAQLDAAANYGRVRVLFAPSVGMTDHDARALGDLQGLEQLTIPDNPITDRALAELSQLQSLTYLDISATDISPEGSEWLRRRLPDCEVVGP
jgi:hypothetical protein